MSGEHISVLAHAKINLHLQVTGRRKDGYHNISSLMQSISLADELTLRILPEPGIQLSIKGAEITDENLAKKAAEVFLKSAGLPVGIAIDLVKRIPLSAGLGGGSADAAAVLLALNRLFDFPLAPERLMTLGLRLGADVPFCMTGGTMKAEGLGEILSPAGDLPNMSVLLIKQHQKSSTRDMYQRIDTAGCDTGATVTDQIAAMIRSGRMKDAAGLCQNSFLAVSPDREAQENLCCKLTDAGAVFTGLSGSGPTVFGLFQSLSDQTVEAFETAGREIYRCTTADHSVTFLNNCE